MFRLGAQDVESAVEARLCFAVENAANPTLIEGVGQISKRCDALAGESSRFGRAGASRLNQSTEEPGDPCAGGAERQLDFARRFDGSEPRATLSVQRAGRAAQFRRFKSISTNLREVGKLSKGGGRRGWLLKIHS